MVIEKSTSANSLYYNVQKPTFDSLKISDHKPEEWRKGFKLGADKLMGQEAVDAYRKILFYPISSLGVD